MPILKLYKITGETWSVDIANTSKENIKEAVLLKYGIPIENQILRVHKNKYYLICTHQEPIEIFHFNEIQSATINQDVFNEKLKEKIKIAKREILNGNIDKLNEVYDPEEIDLILKNVFLYLKGLFSGD